MATDALNLVKQLKEETGKLRALAETVSKVELPTEFGSTLEDVIGTLTSVNNELCVGSSASVQDFDEILNGSLAAFLQLSKQIGGEVAEEAEILNQAFQEERKFMTVVAECKQPPPAMFQELLKPIGGKIEEIGNYCGAKRASKLFNHLASIEASSPMLSWVSIPNKPAPYVKDMVASAMYYTNRVLKEYKEKEKDKAPADQTNCNWTKALIAIINDLEVYIKKHHLTGLSWNRQGKDASAPSAGAAPPPPPGGAGAPPPPPPPAVVPPSGPAAPAPADDAGRNALFAEINQGGQITSGLKKVTDDMKTHKNPELRKQAPKPVSSTPKPYKAPAATKPVAAAKPVQKPARKEHNGKKWDVEYFVDDNNVRIDEADMKETVYIYKCEKSVIHITSKINSVTIDGCKRVGVVCESVLGSLDIVNCQRMRIQVTGKAPIVNIDKTDGCEVYLSNECLNTEVISAKSSEMNVSFPIEGGDGEFKEFPLPEQYKSVYDGKKIITTCVDSLG